MVEFDDILVPERFVGFDLVIESEFGAEGFEEGLADDFGGCLALGAVLFGEIAVGEPAASEEFLFLVEFGGFFAINFDNFFHDLILVGIEGGVGEVVFVVFGGLFFIDVALDLHNENGTLI